MEFVDIAGLVAGASKGEGLGNQFLGNIRETDAIAHVVRCFTDEDVIHVAGKVDPLEDVATIDTELLLADVETVDKAILRISKMAKSANKEAIAEKAFLERLAGRAERGASRRGRSSFTDTERAWLRHYHLLSAKPTMYIANVDESGFADNPLLDALRAHASAEGSEVVPVCAAIEAEIVQLEEDEKSEFLAEMGLEEPGLEPRHPCRLRAARAADLLHRRREGGARLDGACRARPHRRAQAASIPTSRRASSAPRSSATTPTSSTAGRAARRRRGSGGSRARST